MHIQIPEQMLNFIQQQVQSGYYSNAAEVVRDAIRHMMDERGYTTNKRQDFMNAVQIGVDQIEQGQTVPWNDETRVSIRKTARQKVKTGAVIDPYVTP